MKFSEETKAITGSFALLLMTTVLLNTSKEMSDSTKQNVNGFVAMICCASIFSAICVMLEDAYNTCCKNRHDEEHYQLGEDYYYGKNGKVRNYQSAYQHYIEASFTTPSNRHVEATYSLGHMLENKLVPLRADSDRYSAISHYEYAASKGHKDARLRLDRIRSRQVGNQLANRIYQAAWCTRQVLKCLNPASAAGFIGNLTVVKATDLLAYLANTPAIATGGRWAVEGISLALYPIPYVTQKATHGVAHGVIHFFDLSSYPLAKAILMVTADAASECAYMTISSSTFGNVSLTLPASPTLHTARDGIEGWPPPCPPSWPYARTGFFSLAAKPPPLPPDAPRPYWPLFPIPGPRVG